MVMLALFFLLLKKKLATLIRSLSMRQHNEGELFSSYIYSQKVKNGTPRMISYLACCYQVYFSVKQLIRGRFEQTMQTGQTAPEGV